jgi:hypothetical protein
MTHSESVKIDGVEYEVQFEVEPAQKGGMIDESWDAHVIELVLLIDGKAVRPEDLDEDGFDHTGLYSDIEKQLNLKMARGW